MNPLLEVMHIAAVGTLATVVMDAWLFALARMGVRTLDFALVGRWIGHLARGELAHAGIAKAPPIARERGLGWLAHYATGIAFAGVLVAIEGTAWLGQPALAPALAVGIATVVVPLAVVQPAMGAGFFASNTPSPLGSCLRSLASHAVFGAGLYVAAVLIASMTQ